MSTILKHVPVELKDPDKGLVRAVLATFDVVDKDGDITRAGFFGDQPDVPILWGHDWGMMPLGLANITEKDGTAVLDGALNLNTQAGRDALEVLKFQMVEALTDPATVTDPLIIDRDPPKPDTPPPAEPTLTLDDELALVMAQARQRGD